MTPLQEYPRVRQWLYRALWGSGVLLGSVQVWCLATSTTSPSWLAGSFAVLGYVSIATNYTADRNVKPAVDQAELAGEGP